MAEFFRRFWFHLLAGVMIVAILVLIVVVVKGRGSQSDSTSLPPATASQPPTETPAATVTPTSTASVDPVEADKQAIRDQYQRMWDVFVLLPSTPREKWDSLIDPVAVGDAKKALVKAGENNLAAGTYIEGRYVTRPLEFEIKNGQAEIYDCQDTSTVRTRKKATNELVDEGPKLEPKLAQFKKDQSGKWKVIVFTHMEGNLCNEYE